MEPTNKTRKVLKSKVIHDKSECSGVYKMVCADGPDHYIGQTRGTFNTFTHIRYGPVKAW